jgi:hypothetical protein
MIIFHVTARQKSEEFMPMFRVTYASMTAHYGPSFIEAADEQEAKRKFAGTAFTKGELGCITAREVSTKEMQRALQLDASTD